jgi:hypothetical protein
MLFCELHPEGDGRHGQEPKHQPPGSGPETIDCRWRQVGSHVLHQARSAPNAVVGTPIRASVAEVTVTQAIQQLPQHE